MSKAKVNLSTVALAAVKAAHGAAGSKATPAGSKGGAPAKPFKVGAKTFRSMSDLATRDPQAFATLTQAVLVKGGADPKRAGALMAHRTRILHAAGVK